MTAFSNITGPQIIQITYISCYAPHITSLSLVNNVTSNISVFV